MLICAISVGTPEQEDDPFRQGIIPPEPVPSGSNVETPAEGGEPAGKTAPRYLKRGKRRHRPAITPPGDRCG